MTGAKMIDCEPCNGTGCKWGKACEVCEGTALRPVCTEELCREPMTRDEARHEGYYCEACRNVLDEPEALHEAS